MKLAQFKTRVHIIKTQQRPNIENVVLTPVPGAMENQGLFRHPTEQQPWTLMLENQEYHNKFKEGREVLITLSDDEKEVVTALKPGKELVEAKTGASLPTPATPSTRSVPPPSQPTPARTTSPSTPPTRTVIEQTPPQPTTPQALNPEPGKSVS